MFKRIGYFLIGMAAVFQAQALFDGDSFTAVLTGVVLNPFDFLGGSLLFLIGFLMISVFFSHFLGLFYLTVNQKIKMKGKDAAEFLLFLFLFFLLFRFGIWVPMSATVFAFVYGLFSVDLREEKHGYQTDIHDTTNTNE